MGHGPTFRTTRDTTGVRTVVSSAVGLAPKPLSCSSVIGCSPGEFPRRMSLVRGAQPGRQEVGEGSHGWVVVALSLSAPWRSRSPRR